MQPFSFDFIFLSCACIKVFTYITIQYYLVLGAVSEGKQTIWWQGRKDEDISINELPAGACLDGGCKEEGEGARRTALGNYRKLLEPVKSDLILGVITLKSDSKYSIDFLCIGCSQKCLFTLRFSFLWFKGETKILGRFSLCLNIQ